MPFVPKSFSFNMSEQLSQNSDQRTPKKNKFQNKKRGSPYEIPSGKKPKTEQPKFTVFHVNAKFNGERGIDGFLYTANGYVEKPMTTPLYNRLVPDHVEYLSTIGVVPRVFKCQQDGVTLRKEGTNGTMYDKKFLCLADVDEVPSPETIREYLEDCFTPALRVMCDKTNVTMYESAYPIWDEETSYNTVEKWSDIISDQEIHFLVNVYLKQGTDAANVSAYFKQDKMHIYSMWHVGAVPASVINTYQLTAEHLEPQDHAHLETVETDDTSPTTARRPTTRGGRR
jgi:hypothetical protein